MKNYVAIHEQEQARARSSTAALFCEEPAKLIINRRAIAAGLAALVAAPIAGRAVAKELKQLSNVPLAFDADTFAGQMKDGLFLPDYRYPMVRVLFENGEATLWHRYHGLRRGRPVAIETCAPDKNGTPRYSQLSIG